MFITGINYWPINKAMYWWSQFDRDEVERDFKRLSHFNLKVVRIFLHWEDFQPQAGSVSPEAITKLKMVADLAEENHLQLMPTFFCGHMSGVNWLPVWMLEEDSVSSPRFPLYSGGKIVKQSPRNCYTDEEVINAQILQIQKVCTALQGHPAVWAYDLGNEASNWVIPPTRAAGQRWLQMMSPTIKKYSNGCPVTIGMHAEDLEEDRNLWPQDAGLFCDFLSMHAYPFYLSWVEQALDYRILPFLALITAWLGEKPVLLQEFGVPTWPLLKPPLLETEKRMLKCPLFSEEIATEYYDKALLLLNQKPVLGALAWCYADYHPRLWPLPPLQQNLHERYFGLFRHDGTAKASTRVWAKISHANTGKDMSMAWLEVYKREQFYINPRDNLIKLYANYRNHLN
jgi:endo-1,4-beta-mannosidase